MKGIFIIIFLLCCAHLYCENDSGNNSSSSNLVANSEFAKPISNTWKIQKNYGAKGTYSFKENYFEAISETTDIREEYGFQLYQENIKLKKGGIYKVSLESESEGEEQIFIKMTGTDSTNWKTYLFKKFEATPNYQRYEYIFSVEEDDKKARLEFWLTRAKTKIRIRNIKLELIDVYDIKKKVKEKARGDAEKFKKLIWNEEFNYEGELDKTKWRFELGDSGWGNKELQKYTDSPQNAYVKNGVLNIVAVKDDKNKITSARVVTKGLKTFTYGEIEVKAKLPEGKGTWPAIWLYGAGKKYSEIDIMEHVGAEKGTVHFSVHTSNHLWDLESHRTSSIKIEKATEDYNIYTLKWTPEYLKGYVNNVEYFNLYKDDFSPEFWSFDDKMFIILNLAVGGTWGGVEGIDYNSFPQRLEVDYIRVYEYKKN
ncbi:MAG: family 16 glycosylhydrolase [Fusobacteriaceae bacterium]